MLYKLAGMGAICAALLLSQETSTNGSISGTVQDSGTHKPVSGASVADGRQSDNITTDANGHFTIKNLAPATYAIRVYADQGRGPHGTKVVQLSSGQDATVNIQLRPNALLSGRVLNENGEPAPEMQVALIAREYRLSALRYVYAYLAETNDQGQYVIPNVEPGRGFLLLARNHVQKLDASANAPADPQLRNKAIMPTWYPDSDTLDGAEALVFEPGERRENIDLRLQRSASYCVDGVLATEAGPSALNFSLEDHEPTSGRWGDRAMFSMPPSGRSGADGKFRVCNLHPGIYRMTAYRLPEGDGRQSNVFFADSEVIIDDEDVHNVRVVGLPRVAVAGEVVWDGKPPDQPVSSKVRVMLQPLTRAYFHQEIEASHMEASVPGSFTLAGLVTDDYSIDVLGTPEGTYVKDITYGGLSALHEPMRVGKTMGSTLRIVLARDGGTIAVKVADKDGQPVPDYGVVLLPETANSEAALADGMITGQTDQNGTYTSKLIAPGKYFVLAEANVPDRSPETIGRLLLARTHAQTVELAANGQAQAQLALPESEAVK